VFAKPDRSIFSRAIKNLFGLIKRDLKSFNQKPQHIAVIRAIDFVTIWPMTQGRHEFQLGPKVDVF
jgi:hypothetical protein